MRKYLTVMLVLLCFIGFPSVVFAQTESEIENLLKDLIAELDLSAIENLLSNNFNYKDIKEIIYSAITGEFVDFNELVTKILISLKDGVAPITKTFLTVFSVIIICGIFSALKPDVGQLNDLIFIFCYCVVAIIVFSECSKCINDTIGVIEGINKQIEGFFPVLLTLSSIAGAKNSTFAYGQIFSIASNGVLKVLTSVLIPIINLCAVLSLVSSLSEKFSLKKANEFFKDLFKWIIGAIITVFSLFSFVKGITAGSYDNFSIRTLKYAMGSSFPLLGGFAKDGIDVVVASSILIKNAVGSVGIIALFYVILTPFLQILLLSLLLKFLSGICEPIADARICQLINSFSKVLTMLASVLLMVFIIYFITFLVVITTQNTLI